MKTITKSLALWGLEQADIALIAARENQVYRVNHSGQSYALRLHRRGYRTDAQLAAELGWMHWVSKSGLSVPAPRPSLQGPYLQSVDGFQIDVLSWLDGDTLDAILGSQQPAARIAVFHALGIEMAKLHDASDAWPEAATCDRPAWDMEGLLGDTPLWDRFWENSALSPNQHSLLKQFRHKAAADLSVLAPTLDYGLIHADLVPANVMVDGQDLHLIDFDDGGFGFRLFDVATALLKHRSNADYPALETALINGYRSKRDLDTSRLGLFLALRAVTYVGWNITRADEDSSGNRNAKFIAQATALVRTYLQSNQALEHRQTKT